MGINELLKRNGINAVAFFSELKKEEKRDYDMRLKVPLQTTKGIEMVERRVTFTAVKEEFFLNVKNVQVHPEENDGKGSGKPGGDPEGVSEGAPPSVDAAPIATAAH